MLAVYTVISAIVTPMAALVLLLPLTPELPRAGLAPEVIVVTATIAGMLGMIARATAWHPRTKHVNAPGLSAVLTF